MTPRQRADKLLRSMIDVANTSSSWRQDKITTHELYKEYDRIRDELEELFKNIN